MPTIPQDDGFGEEEHKDMPLDRKPGEESGDYLRNREIFDEDYNGRAMRALGKVAKEFDEPRAFGEPVSYWYDGNHGRKTIIPGGTITGHIDPEVLHGLRDLQTQRERIAEYMTGIMDTFGVDWADENFTKSPMRIAKAMVDEWFVGYRTNLDDLITVFPNSHREFAPVMEVGIPFFSHCQHHMAPFFGWAAVAYMPDTKVLGLSKFARIVDAISRKFQLQEHITRDVADFLDKKLAPKGIYVSLYDVTHLCVCSRGARSIGAKTTTVEARGVFATDTALRQEVLLTISRGSN